MDELVGHDATGLSELIRKGDIKPIELLETTIQRIEKLNPKLNAIIYKMYDEARTFTVGLSSHSKGANSTDPVFYGIPFLLKNLFAECKGTPFSEGSRAVQGYISNLDTELVKRYKAAGLIIVGKTNTPEFGILTTTEPALHGPTHNPWNPELSPGGSSGGAAAAVAAGIVPMAHGNDGGGSIRIPASCCGVFGLKPTRGRNPLGPIFGDVGGGIVHEHALTRTVRDSATLLDQTAGPDLGAPYFAPPPKRYFREEVGRETGKLKIGFLSSIPDGWNEETDLHPDCLDAVQDAARLCETLGHHLEEVMPAKLGYPGIPEFFGNIFACFVGHVVAYWQRELGREIGQNELEAITWDSYQAGLKKTGVDYLIAVEEVQRFSRKIARWYDEEQYDLLLSPTMRIPPPKLGAFRATSEDPREWLQVALSMVAFTRTQNITGQPAMSVPLYWNEDNIPIGVQFAGRYGDEATLFRLAGQLEQARPWADRIPPIHCDNELS